MVSSPCRAGPGVRPGLTEGQPTPVNPAGERVGGAEIPRVLGSFPSKCLASNLLQRGPEREAPMTLFLILAALSLVSLAVTTVLFAALLSSDRPPEAPTDERLARLPSHFFADDRTPNQRSAVPLDVLLLQIERHVRLEHAAAESFQHAPTIEALHTATTSPLGR